MGRFAPIPGEILSTRNSNRYQLHRLLDDSLSCGVHRRRKSTRRLLSWTAPTSHNDRVAYRNVSKWLVTRPNSPLNLGQNCGDASSGGRPPCGGPPPRGLASCAAGVEAPVAKARWNKGVETGSMRCYK